MKRILFAIAMAIVAGNAGRACDVCGCAAGAQYLGLLPQYKWNFAGLQQQYGDFSSSHPSAYLGRPYEQATDQYHTFQAWGRVNAGRRYQVFAFVPYRYNVHHEDSSTYSKSGIGDISLLVNRVFLEEAGHNWTHTLQGGAGIKLPTGNYAGVSSADKAGLPNLQPGTGSWDFITNVNYTLRHNKVGANLDASYTFTTASSGNYKYGNRLATGLLGFYTVQIKSIALMPQAGVRYEYTLHDYDNYSKKWLNEQSGGYMCYATAGVQAYYKRVGLRLTYQLPVSQHYGSGYVTAKQKMESGIFFLF